MPFWRGRDRERFIGGYDPEHEMPDPDRMRNDRYESDAYRHNARDSRFGYRWNPDRVEDRWQGRERNSMPSDWNRDARDHAYNERYGPRDYERGAQWDRGWDYDRDRDRNFGSGHDRGDRSFGNYGDRGMTDYGRNSSGGYGRNFDNNDRGYGFDRGYDRNDYGRIDYGRNDYGRGYEDRDRWDRERNFGSGRTMPDWDREASSQHDRDYGWEDVGDIPYDRNRGRRY